MPAQHGKSPILAKYGAKLQEAVAKHAKDKTDYGFQRLPGGIIGGVAKLTECGFAQYKPGSNMKTAEGKSAVGEWYWFARGVVVEPNSVTNKDGTIPVRGLQTGIMEPLCATKNAKNEVTTTEEHVATILNEMRKLAGEDFVDEGTPLESLCEQLAAAGIYFRFSTSQADPTPQYPNPRVFENWNGAKGMGDYVPPSEVSVHDATAPSANGAAHAPEAKAAAVDDEPDLDALADAASNQYQEAIDKLSELGRAAGLSDADMEAADTFAAVVEMIRAAGEVATGSDEEGASATDEPADPVKGEVWKYQPLDPKTKKPLTDPKTKKPRKAVEVEVVAVDAKTRTCTVKDLTTKAVTKGVSFDALEAL